MSQQSFKKFINPKNNAAVKEKFKQEKKVAKRERAEAINKRYEEKRAMRAAGASPTSPAKPVSKAEEKRQKYPQQKASTPQGKPPAFPKQTKGSAPPKKGNSATPLNKYVAHCGVCSRRDAIPLIREGKVLVNGKVMMEPGYKVEADDEIIYNGKKLFVTKNQVYILLNKPKDYITTLDDPEGRKTVFDLIKQATTERIYPIGRLDRNTSGVLLFTNDGELTQKLSHPSYGIKKVYEVKLDKPFIRADFDKVINGIELEDGLVSADVLAYADAKDKSIVGIEIHSGRNRVVRRIFEHLGYDVKALDRVMFANLTKKNVERGKWRFLSEKEIRLLKYLNSSQVGKSTVPKEKKSQTTPKKHK